uniref:Uncharacterized protein n=1 Tax=Rhizophora mucronata TaxID=61149 RepID=A0A2P2MVU9_RHIMU
MFINTSIHHSDCVAVVVNFLHVELLIYRVAPVQRYCRVVLTREIVFHISTIVWIGIQTKGGTDVNSTA